MRLQLCGPGAAHLHGQLVASSPCGKRIVLVHQAMVSWWPWYCRCGEHTRLLAGYMHRALWSGHELRFVAMFSIY